MSAPSIHGRRFARQAVLTLLSAALVFLHFSLPPNAQGLRFALQRIDRFPAEWDLFRREGAPEQRLKRAHGLNYDAPVFIRENLGPDARLQLPPRAYLSRHFPRGQIGWADPRFIYYIAGPVTTLPWAGAIDPRATHAIIVDTLGAASGLRLVDLSAGDARARVESQFQRSGRSPAPSVEPDEGPGGAAP